MLLKVTLIIAILFGAVCAFERARTAALRDAREQFSGSQSKEKIPSQIKDFVP
jgi:uncharacterized membrane protein YdjX (TVP38/TMEM64 family)